MSIGAAAANDLIGVHSKHFQTGYKLDDNTSIVAEMTNGSATFTLTVNGLNIQTGLPTITQN